MLDKCYSADAMGLENRFSFPLPDGFYQEIEFKTCLELSFFKFSLSTVYEALFLRSEAVPSQGRSV